MNSNPVYRGANSDNGPSPELWHDCPWLEAIGNPNIGVSVWDDFTNPPSVTGAPYDLLGDVLPAPLADNLSGVMAVAVTGTDNHQSLLGCQADSFVISDTAAEERKLWFETRIKTDSISDNAMAIGLCANADIAVNLLADDTGALVSTADFVGFRTLTATPSTMTFTYQIGSGAVQNIVTAQTLVATTWYKVGFKYDPTKPAGKRITIYVNGVDKGTYVTAANIAAATFPDSVNMGLVMTVKTGAAAAVNGAIDWWRCFQERV